MCVPLPHVCSTPIGVQAEESALKADALRNSLSPVSPLHFLLIKPFLPNLEQTTEASINCAKYFRLSSQIDNQFEW
jgi:hypothetical protein